MQTDAELTYLCCKEAFIRTLEGHATPSLLSLIPENPRVSPLEDVHIRLIADADSYLLDRNAGPTHDDPELLQPRHFGRRAEQNWLVVSSSTFGPTETLQCK